MKLISETKALAALDRIRGEFTESIRSGYEVNARSCLTCLTPGACCLDAHFVNVRISQLEAKAILNRLGELPAPVRVRVEERIVTAVEKYGLRDAESGTYACPLYEKGSGCLVHDAAKPLPCIAHACYERKEDLPPDELLAEREMEINELNKRAYGKAAPLLPLPVAVMR